MNEMKGRNQLLHQQMVMKKNQRLMKIGDPDNNSKREKEKKNSNAEQKRNEERKMEVQKRMVHNEIERTV